jgi:S-DNA-T family DNA segregation ATPase FtsK/SpoIIIE
VSEASPGSRDAEEPGVRAALRLRMGDRQWDVSVSTRSSATVREVAQAVSQHLGSDAPSQLLVSGQALPADARWADLVPPDGTTTWLSGADPTTSTLRRGSRFEVAVIAGPLAGTRLALPDGPSSLGRGSAAALKLLDPSASRVHLKLLVDDEGVTVEDASSTNRTLANGSLLTKRTFAQDGDVFEIGTSLLNFRRVPAALTSGRRFAYSARRVVQRPPRSPYPKIANARIVEPVAPTHTSGSGFPWLAALLPLVASGVIVAITGRFLYLAFAVLSPMLAIGNVLTDRSAKRKGNAVLSKGFDADTALYRQALDALLVDELRERSALYPDLAKVLSAACVPTALLWHRSPSDPDFLALRVGTSTRASSVEVVDPRGMSRPRPAVTDCPQGLDLAEARVLGLSGDAEVRDAHVRALLAQLLTFHRPADMRITLLTSSERAQAWDWLKWVPHLSTSSGLAVATTADEAAGLVAQALTAASASVTTLVVVDDVPELQGSPALARLLTGTPERGIVALVLSRRFSGLPRACRATLDMDAALRGGPSVLVDVDGSTTELSRLDMLSLSLAEELTTSLAQWLDPDDPSLANTQEPSGDGPLGFLESLGYPDLAPSAVLQRWRQPTARLPVAACGVGDQGLVTVDLRSGFGGPNAFVAGTVGSGKSDFLRSFLISLALANPPDALSMVLVDFKEGSGLEVLTALPHVAAMVSNTERGQLPRILTALTAERELRQQRIKTAGYDSFDHYQESGAAATSQMSRLLIVVDEFAALRLAVPDAMSRLVEIVRRGRSAGMHLVLSSQTVSKDVGQDISDNTSLHVCLRVESEAESRTLIGVPDAARLPTNAQGRGLVSDGQTLRAFQSGWLGCRTADRSVEPAVAVHAFSLAKGIDRPAPTAEADLVPTDMERVTTALTAAANEANYARASPPWEKPLPDVVTRESLSVMPEKPAGAGSFALPLGLLDSPSRRMQLPWTIDLAEVGHLLVIGGGRSGRSSLLRSLACVASTVPSALPAHLYVVEGGARSLAALSELPNVGAVVSSHDRERLVRLLRVVHGEMKIRQALLAELGAASLSEVTGTRAVPRVLLLVDGFEAVYDDALQEEDGGVVADLTAIVRSGPAAGVHVVLTTDMSKIHTQLISSIGARLVLSLPESSNYAETGISRDAIPVGDLPAGRGIWSGTEEFVQVALLAADPSGRAQNDAVHRVGRALLEEGVGTPPHRVPLWEESYLLSRLDAESSVDGVILGVSGADLTPHVLELGRHSPGLLVLGPRESGRTTTLLTVGAQLVDGRQGRPSLVVVTPRGGALADWASTKSEVQHLQTADEIASLPAILRQSSGRVVVLVDECERLLEGTLAAAIEAAVSVASDAGHVLVLAGSLTDIAPNHGTWCVKLKRLRNVLILRSVGRADVQSLGLPPGRLPAPEPAAGRGLLFLDGDGQRVQVALAGT